MILTRNEMCMFMEYALEYDVDFKVDVANMNADTVKSKIYFDSEEVEYCIKRDIEINFELIFVDFVNLSVTSNATGCEVYTCGVEISDAYGTKIGECTLIGTMNLGSLFQISDCTFN